MIESRAPRHSPRCRMPRKHICQLACSSLSIAFASNPSGLRSLQSTISVQQSQANLWKPKPPSGNGRASTSKNARSSHGPSGWARRGEGVPSSRRFPTRAQTSPSRSSSLPTIACEGYFDFILLVSIPRDPAYPLFTIFLPPQGLIIPTLAPTLQAGAILQMGGVKGDPEDTRQLSERLDSMGESLPRGSAAVAFAAKSAANPPTEAAR